MKKMEDVAGAMDGRRTGKGANQKGGTPTFFNLRTQHATLFLGPTINNNNNNNLVVATELIFSY
jgi:hypothetical protein